MGKIELGPVGAALDAGSGSAFAAALAELEQLGYSTLWPTGGPLQSLDQVAEIVRATQKVKVATGILSVDRFGPETVTALYAGLEATHPGRFVVGLGGAHGPQPIATLNAYLDQLTSVPTDRRIMAAIGPRMLDLARERSSGAFPVLITPEYTAQARERLGDDTTLAVEQFAVVEKDPEQARAIARKPLGLLSQVPAYQASFRRMGFGDDDISQLSDRLVDAVVAWGDVDAVATRVVEHQSAGADHVVVAVASPSGAISPTGDHWRQLAAALLG